MKVLVFLLVLNPIILISQNCKFEIDSVTNEKTYFIADQPPIYPGGKDSLFADIRKNLKWPGADCCIEGSVFVEFTIMPDGIISNKGIKKGMDIESICNPEDEALLVIDKLKKWSPAICNGIPVPYKMILPIRFR